jgi:predicted alpha/beta-fold hydrolase
LEHAILFVGLVATLLFGSGCASQILAERIASAPNRHGPPLGLSNAKEVTMADAAYAVNWRTKVGPPAAELLVGVIDPAAYNFVSTFKVETAEDGKERLKIETHWETKGVDGHPLPPIMPPKGTLVLLHGIMMSRESMHMWAVYFAQKGYRIVLVDLRGHGRSTGRWIGYGAWEVADLIKVVDELLWWGGGDPVGGAGSADRYRGGLGAVQRSPDRDPGVHARVCAQARFETD